MELLTSHLKLPKVPENLLNTALATISNPLIQAKILDRKRNIGFLELHRDNNLNDLDNWLRTYITDTNWHLSFFSKDYPVHKDSYTRSRFLYLLDTGGSNVKTNFYEDDKLTLIKGIEINKEQWTLLHANRYHEIKGIEAGRFRYAISGRLHNSTWTDKDHNPYIRADYQIAVSLPRLNIDIINVLINTVKRSSCNNYENGIRYKRVKLKDLGLNAILSHLNDTIVDGDWSLEWIYEDVNLPPSKSAIELSLMLTDSLEAGIAFNELSNKSVNYTPIQNKWYLNVSDCCRCYTLNNTNKPIVNLVCPVLGK